MKARWRFSLRALFAITGFAAVLSLGLACAWPTIVDFFSDSAVPPVRYVPAVAARYNAFRTAIANRKFDKAYAMTSPNYRSEHEPTFEEFTSWYSTVSPPQAISGPSDVRGRGNVAIVEPTSQQADGVYYRWIKLEGEWYLDEVIYTIS